MIKYYFLLLSLFNISLCTLTMKGMTFVGDRYCSEVPFTDPLAIESLNNLKSTGCNYIALVVTEYQDYADSTEIYPIYENYIKTPYYIHKTETIEGIKKIVNEAHRLSMKVMMKPHIDLSKEPNYDAIWRGDIGGFSNEEDWEKWFASYEKMILKYAKLSQELNVEMLSVSCELINVNHRDENWRAIIKKIREVYKGSLVSSANHSGEETSKNWWDVLDYIGVDAYYIGGDIRGIQKDFDSHLEEVMNTLESLSKRWNKQVIITEYGICSGRCMINNRNHKPTLTDHYLQAYFYERSLYLFSKKSFIEGIFWWSWNTDPNTGGLKDHCITPQHKMAQAVMTNYYGGNIGSFTGKPKGEPKCLCTI
ncbi:MAG: glycosyl hydrolase [archaeon]|nr:glycosyl hydrolase [archaeon]